MGVTVKSQPAGGDERTRRSRQWERRSALSRALRIGVFAGPVALSFGVALALGHLLPRAQTVPGHIIWVAVIAAASLLTLIAVERATRKLLPLAALLNLSLVFPDKAPARFAVARRTGRPRELRASLDRARQTGRAADAERMGTVIELVLALSVHDRASRGHSERVRVFTDLIADELKVPESGRNRLRWAALLHDIGKLEVPPAILNKPAKPSEGEWARLHRHPEDGARLVASLLPWLGEWGLAVVQHHERFDGKGYPHGLKGNEISLSARIVSVADVYEVMTAPRPYKPAMSVSTARAELVRVAGSQLDPVIVRAFLNISVGRLWKTIGFGAWIGQIPTLARLLSFGSWGSSGLAFATAATATVLAVAGVAGPPSGPTPTFGHGPAVASAPSNGTAQAPPGSLPLPTAPRSTAVTGKTGTTSGPATPAPSSSAVRPPTPGTTPTSTRTPTPTPTRTPTPTPGPTPTTTPTPDPCPTCTNPSPTCPNHCINPNLAACTTWCEGANNTVCNTHCFGNNNLVCISYCTGANNPRCQNHCSAVTVALSELQPFSVSGAQLIDETTGGLVDALLPVI
jgi:HD-GYP domain-containing protein (c-di-GMP phosphodiesterase class II)